MLIFTLFEINLFLYIVLYTVVEIVVVSSFVIEFAILFSIPFPLKLNTRMYPVILCFLNLGKLALNVFVYLQTVCGSEKVL